MKEIFTFQGEGGLPVYGPKPEEGCGGKGGYRVGH